MQTKIASSRKKCFRTVLSFGLLIILCIVAGQIGSEALAGNISGKVTRNSDGAGIQGAYVYAYDSNHIQKGFSLQTDSSGNYTVGGLLAGSYYLVTWNDQGYIDEYYDNVAVPGSSWPPAGATELTVTATSNTPDINFSLTSTAISGRVVKASDGTGIQDVKISVYNMGWNLVMDVWTQSSGEYAIGGLLTGGYYLKTSNDQGYIDKYYDNVTVPGSSWPPAGATKVNVVGGSNTPNINFSLALGGSISGRVVKDSDGTGIQGIGIRVLGSNGNQFNGVQTDSSGNYTVGNLPTGSYYLKASSDRYIEEYYDNVRVAGSSWPPAGATTVSVTAGSTTGNKNFGLRKRLERVNYDGDGKADIGVYRGNTGGWFVILSSTGGIYGFGYGGLPEDVPVPADYDGDGLMDIAVYRNGAWFINKSSTGGDSGVGFGSSGDIPVPGDYDGDGKADIAVYRPSTGAWFIYPSLTGPSGIYGVGFGSSGDKPVPGDYDGDGKTDIAVYRPSTGAWFIYPSSTGSSGIYGVGFGSSGDIPVPGDYDGDGKTDIAVYRPSTGAWFIYPSSTGSSGIYGMGFGASGDIPVPGDYDGDGKTDIAVYRPSTGAWFIYPSSTGSSGIYGMGFGGDPSDIPLNRAAILSHYY